MYQKRYLLYCKYANIVPGSEKNMANYICFILSMSSAYKKEINMDYIANQEDFTLWIEHFINTKKGKINERV